MIDTIEGRNPVLEALRAGRPISKILLARDMPRHSAVAEILNLAQSQGIPVEYVERRVLDQKSQTTASQGVIAYAAAKEYLDLDELFAISRQKNEPPLYVVLDGIEDPYNLGAIIRSAEATGVHGIIIRSRREVGLTATVVKASAGAIEYVPVARVVNIAQTIETLKQNNVWVIGIDMSGEQQYSRVNFKLPTAIV
ncbi:MAG: RNA methyltransferase, partial [Dehalococcoidales bacterium]|nr:RNA methyltransferase [Dehalococcoidales bacterium]